MAEDVAQPKRIGGFELLEQIGAGGMGTVWKARQVSLDRVVALKLLASDYSQNAEFLTRFRNEARAAANLAHRHIVQVYDAGKADGTDYLAMEYVEGKTVRAKLEAQGMMPETEVLDTIIPIAQALQYAWEHAKLIHRDVKPDNIIIDQDGTVKLLDLGLAKSVAKSENLKITKSGQSLGTAFYISPEQAEARGDLDLRTDIYGLGATTYHMVTGKAPFEELATATAMLQHVEGVLPDARKFQPQLSESLCMVIERMMAKDREDRYESWQQLIADLQLVRSGRRPVNARIAPGRSTLQRRENVEPGLRGMPLPEAGPLIHVEPARHILRPVMWAGLGVIALCLIGIVLLLIMSQQRQELLRAELASQKKAARADAARGAYYEAVDFARNNPQAYGEILKRFNRVSTEFSDIDDFAKPAAKQVQDWQKRRDDVMKQRVQQEAAERAARQAAAATQAAEQAEKAERERKMTEAAREAEAKRRAAEEAARATQAAQAAYNEFSPAWIALLARRDYAGALQAAQKAASDPRLALQKDAMETHLNASERLVKFAGKLLAADSPLIGKSVALSSASGRISAISGGRGIVVERVAGVGVTVAVMPLASDDYLRVCAAAVKPGDVDDQINYALMLLAERRFEPARAAVQAITDPQGGRFNALVAGVMAAQAEAEATATLADLRAQIAVKQWTNAFARLLALDVRYTNTTTVIAAGTELSAAHDQLLALPPAAGTADAAARVAVSEARRAIESASWERALNLVNAADAQLAAGALPAASQDAVLPELDALRQRVINESGLPGAAVLADALRHRAVQSAGGRVWVVNTDATGGDVATLADAVAKVQSGDAIELGPGTHLAVKLDGSAKTNILIYGRGGALPVVTDLTATNAPPAPGSMINCGADWRLENLCFQFNTTALNQSGTNLAIRNCAFMRSPEWSRQGLVVFADCGDVWRTTFDNCLIAAGSSEVVWAQPRTDGATRHVTEFNHCTIWLPGGAVLQTGRRTYARRFALTINNSAVLAQRLTAATWTRELISAGLNYGGDHNLMFVFAHQDDIPEPGEENWKALYPGTDGASVIAPLQPSVLAALRRGRQVPGFHDFVAPAAGDFRLASASRGTALADDRGEVGVRWPGWFWTQFFKTVPWFAPSEVVEAGALLPPITPPVLNDTQQVKVTGLPITTLFKGAVRPLPGGRIELTYDFASPEQLNDWRITNAPTGPEAELAEPAFIVTNGALQKVTLDQSLLAHNARFRGDVELKFDAAPIQPATQTVGVIAGVVTFPQEQLMATVDYSSGLRIISRQAGSFDVVTNLPARLGSPSFHMEVSTASNRFLESVAKAGDLDAPLPRARGACEVALGANRVLAQFNRVQIAGALDTNWLALARARAMFGADFGVASTNVATTNFAAAAEANLAAAIAALTRDQRLRAAQIPLVSLFKGQVKNLGTGKHEWSYDFSRPEQGADWRSDTLSVWGIGSGVLNRAKGEGQPFWFRGRLRGEFSVTWKAVVKEGKRCNLVVRYGEATNALQAAVGLGLNDNVWCGIGRYGTNANIETMATAGGALSARQSALNFSCSQLGDLLKIQMRQSRQELVPAQTYTRTLRPDTVLVAFDSDDETQFELDDVRITGVLDPAWIKDEQLRVVALQQLAK